MSSDVDETAYDLFKNGLKPDEDFTFVNAAKYAIYMGVAVDIYKPPPKVKLRIDWLKSRYANGGVYVCYVESK